MRVNIQYKITLIISLIVATILVGIFAYLKLTVALTATNQPLNSLTKLFFVSLAIGICLSLVLGFFASCVVFKPIKEVSLLAKSIAAGDFSRTIGIYTDDEFGDLSNSINFMSKQIKERIDEVVSNRLRLEAVLLSMFDGVMVVDKHGKMILMNQALRNLFQVMDEIIGKKPIEVIRNADIQDIASQVTQKNAGYLSRELTVLFPQEKPFHTPLSTLICKTPFSTLVIILSTYFASSALTATACVLPCERYKTMPLLTSIPLKFPTLRTWAFASYTTFCAFAKCKQKHEATRKKTYFFMLFDL